MAETSAPDYWEQAERNVKQRYKEPKCEPINEGLKYSVIVAMSVSLFLSFSGIGMDTFVGLQFIFILISFGVPYFICQSKHKKYAMLIVEEYTRLTEK